MIFFAFSTSAASACTKRRNLYVLSPVSTPKILAFGNPFHKTPAPTALKPPTTTAPSSAATIHATSGPATSNGPIPGMAKKADPNSNPQQPPQKAPILPQYFIRSPVL